jgi:hypothetical protein
MLDWIQLGRSTDISVLQRSNCPAYNTSVRTAQKNSSVAVSKCCLAERPEDTTPLLLFAGRRTVAYLEVTA